MQVGMYSEVVSATEFSYSQQQGVTAADVIVNGPGKHLSFLKFLVDQPVTLIVDSLQELDWLVQLHASRPVTARVGLRVAPTLSFVKSQSRFGVDLEVEDNLSAVRDVVANHPDLLQGMHLHHSGDRSLGAFIQRLEFLFESASRIGLDNLRFVDCGGGLASAIPNALADRLNYSTNSLDEYGVGLGQHMKSLCPDLSVELILEPGTGLLADAGVFMSVVEEVKQVSDGVVVVVDGTLFCIDPLRSSVPPEVAIVSPAKSMIGKPSTDGTVRLYGNSCMEIDQLHPNLPFIPSHGDIVLIAQKGAYAACMASPFIQGMPASLEFHHSSNSFSINQSRNSGHALDGINLKKVMAKGACRE